MVKIKYSDILLPPNILSLIRLLLILPVILLFSNYEQNRLLLVLLAFIASFLDNLDGYLARKNNQITELGKIIDPLADKALVAIFIVSLFLLEKIPLWFFMMVIARDLVIVSVSMFLIPRAEKVMSSNLIGKITVTCIGVTIIFPLIGFNKYENTFNGMMIFTSILIVMSLISYGMATFKK